MACAGATLKSRASPEAGPHHFHGKAAEFAARLGAAHVALSLSHTAEQAIAQVILET